MGSGSKILGFIGVLGVMASSLAFVLFSAKEVPTVGLVAPVFAAAPERVELRSLRLDETLGDLLEDVLDPSDRYGVVTALRERANPRRLRPGTEVAFRWLTAAPSELAGCRYCRRRGLDGPDDAVTPRLDLERDDYAGGDGYRVGRWCD